MSDVPCGMTIQDVPRQVEVGHYMASTGTGYRVIECRLVRGHSNKYRLRCLRCPLDDIPSDAVIHHIKWFSRGKND